MSVVDAMNSENHQNVLSKYRSIQTGSGWHTAPDDGYLYDHLTYHLQAAGFTDELKSLFTDQNWFRARLRQDNYKYDGYLSDLLLAWETANNDLRNQTDSLLPPTALIDCFRYALIRTSVNSLDASYPPELVMRALELHLWQPDQALSVAQKIPDPYQKMTFIGAILGAQNLEGQIRSQTMDLGLDALEAYGRGYFGDMLSPLLAHLKDANLDRTFDIIKRAEPLPERLNALTKLAKQSHDNPDRLRRIVEAYLSVSEEIIKPFNKSIGQDFLLASLVPHFDSALLNEHFDRLISSPITEYIAPVLIKLVAKVDAERQTIGLPLLADFLTRATTPNVSMLTALAELLSGDEQERILQTAYDPALKALVEQPQGPSFQNFVDLILLLTGEKFYEALTVLFRSGNDWQYVGAIVKLMPKFTAEHRRSLIDYVLNLCETTQDERLPPWALKDIAPHLEETDIQRGLNIALQIPDPVRKVECLSAYIPLLDQATRHKVITQALSSVLDLQPEYSRSEALTHLAPFLPDDSIETVLLNALSRTEKISRDRALAVIASKLNHQQVQKALNACLMISDTEYQSSALAALAPYLPYEMLKRGLQIVLYGEYTYTMDVSSALVRWIPQLPDDLFVEVFDFVLQRDWNLNDIRKVVTAIAQRASAVQIAQALDVFLSYKDAWTLCNAVIEIAPGLSPELLQKALIAVRRIEKDWTRLTALAGLVPYLDENQRDTVLDEALDILTASKEDLLSLRMIETLAQRLTGRHFYRCFQLAVSMSIYHRNDAVRALAPYAPQDFVSEFLLFARELQYDVPRAMIIEALAPRLRGEYLRQAVDIVLKLSSDSDSYRWAALARLMSFFSGDLLVSALEIALTIENESSRSTALVGLMRLLPEAKQVRALQYISQIDSAYYRGQSLIAVLPYLNEDERRTAIDQFFNIVPETMGEQWWYENCWRLLIQYLTQHEYDTAIECAFSVKSPYYRVKALVALLPIASDPGKLLADVHRAIGESLLSCTDEARSKVLELCADKTLFAPPVFEANLMEKFADQILEICQEWEWV